MNTPGNLSGKLLQTSLVWGCLAGGFGWMTWKTYKFWHSPQTLDEATDDYIKDQVAKGMLTPQDGARGLCMNHEKYPTHEAMMRCLNNLKNQPH